MRQDRVRALADDAPPPSTPKRSAAPAELGRPAHPGPGTTGVPGVPGAPVVQPRQSRVPDADGVPGRTPAQPRPSERAAAERGAERAERPQQRLIEKPVPPPSVPASPSVIDDVAVEAEEMLREQGAIWARFSVADKISFLCAILTLGGTLLPWLWRKNEEVMLGLSSGGIVHAAIAIAGIGLLIARERPGIDERGLRPTPHQQKRRARRTALWMLLLALASTVAGTWFLLVYGAVRRFEVPTLEVGAGLYVTLAAGLGLSYSGFAFFWRGGRTRDD